MIGGGALPETRCWHCGEAATYRELGGHSYCERHVPLAGKRKLRRLHERGVIAAELQQEGSAP